MGPQEWLLHKCQQKAQAEDSAYLFGVIVELMHQLDGDIIQDAFQSEMDEDGYFDVEARKPLEESRPC